MLITVEASPIQYQSTGLRSSDGIDPGLSGSDTNGFLDVGDEYLAITNASGLSSAPDSIDRPFDQIIPDNNLDFHLREKVHDVFRASIKFGVALLPTEALGFRDRDALEPDFLKCFLYLVELEWLDDRFNFLHGTPPGHFEFRLQVAWSGR